MVSAPSRDRSRSATRWRGGGCLPEDGVMPPHADIRIVDYDPEWPRLAAAVIDALRGAAPGLFAEIEHIGSTAVPGLAAKPVLDLMAAVDDLEAARSRQSYLADLGFHPHDNGMTEPAPVRAVRERHPQPHPPCRDVGELADAEPADPAGLPTDPSRRRRPLCATETRDRRRGHSFRRVLAGEDRSPTRAHRPGPRRARPACSTGLGEAVTR
jgi:GrpB-like predicted nucleotidyltransferase (UPF0157 family)